MSQSIAGPAYTINTARTLLRCWQPSDAPLLQDAMAKSVEHLRPWMPWAHDEPEPLDAKVERLRQFRGMFDLGHDFIYGVFDAEQRVVLGGTGLHTRIGEQAREIGYWIHAEYLNRGLATEISAALVKVAFAIDKVDRVEIHCDPANVRSAAVARKLGFALDQPVRERMIWSLLAADYPDSPAARAEIAAYDVIGRRIL